MCLSNVTRYLVGTGSEPMPVAAGRTIHTAGWVHAEYCCAEDEAPPCGGLCEDSAVFRELPVSSRYIASMYKVLNALENANTSSEMVQDTPFRTLYLHLAWAESSHLASRA